jgi:DNA-binding transcriptional MerR regulator
MFRIGEFARFTRVSVKMLRHYDEIGLLPPARVDAATGYRYYRAAQLTRLNRILLLRELGFGLDEIARLVDELLEAHGDRVPPLARHGRALVR